ncbi:MAG: alanine--glyoxylate aminotransferase family protein [Candidatus Omnitrophica bacterium]|nr:alanine--glyoxylate aminotransferase family protein [Candidatus Omnitrophota bacterium]MBU1127671.1 alanine--glyoxylate aminotransferase family protein [Candidatus Omnitrophota bacterium]MBU1784708.1 alanine--glyoxylate aminotransferase family protein [Candidatus Omnitrophota bacterium]MBU1851460.1 alanine--glyoxylate aminotransferase family protein [Candidatus Omnitrophota bacterium]
MRKYRLMAPGPTPVPEKVLLKMADTLIHHRTPQFQTVLKNVNDKLKKVFCTRHPVLMFASSGTGAMETSVVNLLSRGDKVIVIRGGKFGERFGEISEAYGVRTVNYDVNWGAPADPEVVGDLLAANPGVKAVFSTLCETSTGIVNDIRSIGGVVSKTDAVLVVDAISGLSADELKPDEWGVDVVIGGSQKGLMLPPGLSFLSVSSKAEKLIENSDLPKYYFSLKAALKSYAKNDTPWTPAVSLIQGLNEVLDMMLREGLDNILVRHARLAEATRMAMIALGMELFSEKPSNAVTAVKVPKNVDGQALVKKMRDEQGMTIAGGQGDLKGKIFRIAHLGYMDKYDTIAAIAAVGTVLRQLGYQTELGKGVAKAEEILLDE